MCDFSLRRGFKKGIEEVGSGGGRVVILPKATTPKRGGLVNGPLSGKVKDFVFVRPINGTRLADLLSLLGGEYGVLLFDPVVYPERVSSVYYRQTRSIGKDSDPVEDDPPSPLDLSHFRTVWGFRGRAEPGVVCGGGNVLRFARV